MPVLASGQVAVTVDAGHTIQLAGLDLEGMSGREVTLAIAFDNLVTYTAVTAILNWGVESLGSAEMAPGRDGAAALDTLFTVTGNGADSKRMHVGGDKCELFLDPAGVGGTVTVHYAVVG